GGARAFHAASVLRGRLRGGGAFAAADLQRDDLRSSQHGDARVRGGARRWAALGPRLLRPLARPPHAGGRPARTLPCARGPDPEPHEPAMRARDGEMVAEIERQFLALRSSLDGPKEAGGGRGGGDTEAIVRTLDSLLERADARGPGGALVAFVAALAIALREGVEAALLVAALLAILRKAGRSRDASAVHSGWIAALALGAVTWWATGALLVGISGAKRELVEGIGQLVTAALLLYASHWLLAAASAKRLVSFLSEHAVRAGSAE